MKKFSSLLVITLLLIAFGRCVADQYGMLHSTQASCCQTICNAHEAEANCDDAPQHEEEEHNNEEAPAPCKLCYILENDSMQIENGTKAPLPVISNFTPIFKFGTFMGSLLSSFFNQFLSDNLITDLPDPPTELGSLFQCMVTKATPVRGPSIA